MNGYNREWSDLAGYSKWTKQPMIMKRVGAYEWAYSEIGEPKEIISRSYLQFLNGLYIVVRAAAKGVGGTRD